METQPLARILAIGLCGLVACSVVAAERTTRTAPNAPKGGRWLEKTQPVAEFVVEKDKTLTINFYNSELKPVGATTQSVTAHLDSKGKKLSLEFEKKGNSLVSAGKIPEGDDLPIVVQFKQTSETKPRNFRFKLDLHTCNECKLAEYACTCDH